MKHIGLLVTGIFTLLFHSNAQQVYWEKLGQEFANCTNDSVFALTKSPYGYRSINYEYHLMGRKTLLEAFIYDKEPGCVYGPLFMDTVALYIKIAHVDSASRGRAGHMMSGPLRSFTSTQARSLRDSIYKVIQSGVSFDTLCKYYTKYPDYHVTAQCDMGYFYEGNMVKPFDEAIFTHNTGEIFLAETQFGFHIIKNLDQPVKERVLIVCTLLYIPLNGREGSGPGYAVFRKIQ